MDINFRPDLNSALSSSNIRVKNEILQMIAQYIEDRGFHSSALHLRDSIRLSMINENSKIELIQRLTESIKLSDWPQIENLIPEFHSHPKLIYRILRVRFLDLLTSNDPSTFQFLSTRLHEFLSFEDPPGDFQLLCQFLVSAPENLPNIKDELASVLKTLENLLSQTDSPLVETRLPENRLLHLLEKSLSFQFGKFRPSMKIKTLLKDYIPPVIPSQNFVDLPLFHKAPIRSIAFIPDTNNLLSAGQDKILTMWNVNTKQKIEENHSHYGTIWSVTAKRDISATGCGDGFVRIFDSRINLISKFTGHIGDVYSVDIDPDLTHIVSGGSDMTVILWDTNAGIEETSFKAHSGSVTSVLFDHEGNLVISGGKDHSVQIWDVRTYLVTMQLTPVLGEVSSLSSDTKRILASTKDNTHRIWDLRSPTQVKLLKGHMNSTKHFVRAQFGPTYQTVISGSDDGKICVWDSLSCEMISKIKGHTGHVFDVIYSNHLQIFASCGSDQNIRLWEPELILQKTESKKE